METIVLLEWLLLLNFGLLCLIIALIACFPRGLWKMSSVFVRLSQEEYTSLYALFITLHELLIVFFLLMPYIALKWLI
ncbi:hypothetical protein OAT84_02680 [Gammaproteobacteria bacterium]|nr:hypothetical protein [Gammaproteobacteria bacterium]